MRYGVWGLGVVGKSVLRFLAHKGHNLSVMDARTPTDEEQSLLEQYGAAYFAQSDEAKFFSSNDYIIPSPGIDVTPMAFVKNKLLPELDLFCAAWKKPLIAVTGSLGKTTTVAQLSAILQQNSVAVATGGNIGTGMLDLVGQQDDVDYGLLELSSFQLEFSQHIAPDLAIITNMYPNHLDRHGTFESYVQAKLQILAYQRENQHALVPLELASRVQQMTDRPINYFSMLDAEMINHPRRFLKASDTLYTWQNGQVIKTRLTENTQNPDAEARGNQYSEAEIITTVPTDMPGYAQTWLTLIAACDLLGLLKKKDFSLAQTSIPPHRLEKINAKAPYTFYNDSKSTVLEATQAALNHLKPARVHLLLGGISKGVNRAQSISEFKDKVASVACFGIEASSLYHACLDAGIDASKHQNLDSAFKACLDTAKIGDTILLSPSGASYDLYKNYQERGDHFKRLVQDISNQ